MPTSFGAFKPVGWVMLGLPARPRAVELVLLLQGAGWPSASVLHFVPSENAAELQALVDQAGCLGGYGYEITLLRLYVELTGRGTRWLLVKVEDPAQAADVARLAHTCGATLAVHYRSQMVEELIDMTDCQSLAHCCGAGKGATARTCGRC